MILAAYAVPSQKDIRHEGDAELEKRRRFLPHLRNRHRRSLNLHLSAVPPGGDRRHCRDAHEEWRNASLAVEIDNRDADDGPEERAQNPHSCEVRDASHALDQRPLTIGHQAEKHGERQQRHGADMLFVPEGESRQRPAKHEQQNRAERPQDHGDAPQHRDGARDAFVVAGAYGLGDLANAAVIDSHFRDAARHVGNRRIDAYQAEAGGAQQQCQGLRANDGYHGADDRRATDQHGGLQNFVVRMAFGRDAFCRLGQR